MKSAIGKGMTREDHPEVSNQVIILIFIIITVIKSFMLITLLEKIQLL